MPKQTEEVVVTGTPVRRQQAEPETKSYKLRKDAVHFMDGEKVKEDESVDLTDAEYAAFADKFEPSEEPARRSGKLAKGVEDVEPLRDDTGNPPPTRAQGVSHAPQDIGGKTPDLDAPRANPGNLTRGTHTNSVQVAGGVPVRAEALQSASEPDKKESETPRDAKVNRGQQQPIRNSVDATTAGGNDTAVAKQQNEGEDKK